ncbi:MAG TPA: TlpA disulfide reductase family protein [Bacteroidales bacterium]
MKKVVLIVVSTLLLMACNSLNAYNIKGEMGDKSWDGKQVTLLEISTQSGLKSIDSTLIKDGAFKLKGKVDTIGWYVLMVKKEDGQPIYKDFYLDGDISYTMKNGKVNIKGSPVNNAYQAFGEKYDSMTANIVKLNTELKANPTNKELEKAFNAEYAVFEKSFRELAKNTILENLDNPVGLHLFQAAMSSLENKDIENILAKAKPAFLADPTVKMVISQLKLSKKVGIGSKFSDLTMSKPDGSSISLSDYVGKGSYVLVDFWASWCGPCMQELPNVLACYDKYHQKGFEIVGISLDKDANAWKNAIKNHKMTWPQMSDLAGWKSQAVTVYSFSGIPHTVLMDPKGIIIAKDLRGSALDEKLAELLGK